uniref:C2HC/C3H-type domain-containing protein n=1 Tax=Stomoxys calcitrans TaxID=35570 RepID=A0A1I8P2P7_STOCA
MGPLVSDNNNNSRSSNGRSPASTNGIRLNPVITKKSPSTTASRTTAQPRTSSSASRTSTMSRTSTITNGSSKSPAKTNSTTSPAISTSKGLKTTAKGVNGKPATFVMAVKPPPRIKTPPPGMAACQYCQRNFNEDRLQKHEDVCRKMTSTKRKIFDASKHRVKGTEAEKYVAKKGKLTAAPKISPVIAAVKNNAQADGSKKSNWRKKHEEFINAIREAKKVQAYLAKGGKLSDLPPPPPSENPDYIQCPHCNRRFNESAAERHIPKCANMQHNKPKPVQKKRY